MNRNIVLIFFLLVASCATDNKFSTTDFASQYKNLLLEPSFRTYITGNDSATLLFELNRDGLLFMRNENGVFNSSVVFSLLNYNNDRTKTVFDSTNRMISINYDSINNTIRGTLNFRTCRCINYIKIKITDVNRNQDYIYGLTIDNRINGSSAQFNITDNFGEDLMSTILQAGTSVNIIPPSGSTKLYMRGYFRDYPLALPPFSVTNPPVFDLHSDSLAIIDNTGLEGINFSKEGLYLFQPDTNSNEGFAILCTGEDFPAFTTADQLIDALRYLTTRKEYEKLIASNEKKKSVDEFWLEKAGNNERGRKLIRVYYGRAHDANVHFTSYLDGWKTDRGMTYIIFGPPNSVYRTQNSETWTYHFSDGLPASRFIFTKMQNPFSGNDYVLQRGPELQNIWYMAVDSWRAGRIVGDY
ncbi:MAG: GWxTD domain-containing protein [Bacteroidota bacterium]